MMHSADIVVHINETLDGKQQEVLSDKLCRCDGVVSAEMGGKRPHFMIVGYNSLQPKPVEVISNIRDSGLHAQLVAWL